jgi:hypothetical protein
MPDTRVGLEQAARAGKRSLSQEIERRLRESLSSDVRRADHIRALGELVKLTAENIEQITGTSWLTDPFTAEAVRHAIDQVLSHFAPPQSANGKIPTRIEQIASAMPTEIAEAYKRPVALAVIQATGLTAWVESAQRAEPPNEWSDPFDPIFLRRQLFRDLLCKKPEQPK